MKEHIHKPPRLAEKLLEFYCDDSLVEEVAGDLEERFLDHTELHGLRRAQLKYWLNVLKFFRWHTLKRRKSNRLTQNNITMFKNHLKIAFRNALKQKAYSFINLSGLVVGLTSFILIMIYVQHQLSYDQFHENKDRIYRLVDDEDAITPNILTPFAARNFSDELVHTVRMIEMGSEFFKADESLFAESVLYADPAFFSMFTFPLIQGDPETALAAPNSLVVSKSAAIKHFGTIDIMGKQLELEGRSCQVVAVMADMPDNSVIKFDFVAPFYDLSWTQRETWSNSSYYSFVQLENEVEANAFADKLKTKIFEELNLPIDGGAAAEEKLYLQPLSNIYLQKEGKLEYEIGSMGNIRYVYIFSAVALLVLLIACVNYVNLSTSRSLARAKEVGVRKVMGAYRGQLIGQFLSESFCFVFSSLLLSYALAHALLPAFGQLARLSFDYGMLLEVQFLGILTVIGVLITLLAGFYPAIILSAFRPVTVLKGQFKNSGSGARLRKVLVIFQFAISAFLVIATLVVNKQLNFIQNKSLGFDREQLMYFIMDDDLRANKETLQNTLNANVNVMGTSFTSHIPLSIGSAYGIQTGPTDKDWELIYFMAADEYMIDLMGMDLIAGVGFDQIAVPFDETDTTGLNPSFIINETAAALFNWRAEEAVGKTVNISGIEAPVQGVVADFHFKSMEQDIEPFVIVNNPEKTYYGIVRLGGGNVHETLAFMEETMTTMAPTLPFNYKFLDERFDQMYRFESQLGEVFLTFASIAIAIACLGMFGLISFMALNRVKEFGIRKVLGASVKTIVLLMSTGFLKLVGIALLLALPLSYYLMSRWLDDYAYRSEPGLDTALLTIAFAVSATVLTIAYQALKTALVNPSKILRNE